MHFFPTSWSVVAVLWLGLFALGCSGQQQLPLDPSWSAVLHKVQTSSEQEGTLIYQGEVSAQQENEILFRYERRVREEGDLQRSAHISRSAATEEIVVYHAAVHNASYELVRFESVHKQTGDAGTVEISGQEVIFSHHQNGEISVVREEVSDPVVVGPTLFGFLAKRWDTLIKGNAIDVRFALLERRETIGFTAELGLSPGAGKTAFVLSPTSALIGLFVAPLTVVFDTKSRRALTYHGPVPPKRDEGETLVDFSADVVYAYHTQTYR